MINYLECYGLQNKKEYSLGREDLKFSRNLMLRFYLRGGLGVVLYYDRVTFQAINSMLTKSAYSKLQIERVG